MTFFRWSRVAASDATADTTCPFPEGMAASALNDSSRGQMAALAKFRDDIAGAIVTGGTLNAYTVTSYQGFDTLGNLSGQMIAFSPHATNGDTVTLNVDGLGAKPLRSAPSTELRAGTLIAGTPYVAIYNNSDGAFYLRSFYGNPYNIPLGAGIDFWGATAPNSSFVFPVGQAISRTTYATLFALFSTTFGAGDGSTTFNIPDVRGRLTIPQDDLGGLAASRVTTAGGGIDGSTLGAVGGSQSSTLITANLPAYTPSGTVASTSTVTGGTFGGTSNTQRAASSVDILVPTGPTAIAVGTVSTFTGTPQGGTSAAFANMPPAIMCNYILRVL